ncbi:MAG TPA: hypothetical protein VE907_14440 [Gammaproteobacteria bacterium]|nr:hypothetical protein [Gammaproteobacteria bacterium]
MTLRRRLVAICSALVVFGCARPSEPVTQGTAPAAPAFVGHAWTLADDSAPRGALWIFLPDGTLLQDSCFETHRLSHWTSGPDGALRWEEDGVEIRATVVAATDDAFALRLDLVGGAEERRFVRAAVPYVCADFPR